MQILLMLLITLLHKTSSLQILLKSVQETCFALTTEKDYRINLHIFSHDKNDYQHFQYFILDPDMKPILRKNKLKPKEAIVRNQLKAKTKGRY